MKLKFIFLLFLLISLTYCIKAQPPRERGHRHNDHREDRRGDRRDRVEALRAAYLTKHINLSPAEAQQFWPIYNEFQTKEDSIENAFGDTKLNRMETLSDKELEVAIENRFKTEEARTKLRREYYEKLKKVLPIRKIALLQRAERDFRRELVDMLRG
jgi:hypothetical protein